MKRPNFSTGTVAAQVTAPPVVRGRIASVVSPYWAAIAIATGFLFSAGKGVGHAEGGISTEGPFTVFRTGTNEPLLTLRLPFSGPPANSPALLRFDFGFATAEADVPDVFFDSFSVTLQRNEPSASALLLTADRTGVQWAPANPGGLELAPGDVQHAPGSFPDLNPALALRFAYSISFALPAALAGGPLTLFLDLFDNLNAAASLAYVQGVRIESAVPAAVKLHSAAAIGGSFAEEPDAVLDETTRTFTLGRPAGNRFFRVLADKPTRIPSIRVVGQDLVIEYLFVAQGQLALLTSASVTGPFATDTNAVWNPTNRTFTLTKGSANVFYRIAGDRTTRITGIRISGSQVVLEYQFIQITLQSSAAVNATFAQEGGAVLDETNRTLTLTRPVGSRFYRLSSDAPSRLRPPRVVGNQLLLDYVVSP